MHGMNANTPFDKATYESSRIYLKTALEHMLVAGRSARELSEFALEKFGAGFLPYLQQFLRDVSHGRILIDGLSRSARDAVLGHHVTDDQRDEMIRQVAYLRAERRGFAGGSPEQDWIDAEREVDEQLARRAGLVVKGSKALASVTATVEKELVNSGKVVTRWLDRKFPAGPAVKKSANGKKPPAGTGQGGSTGKQAASAKGSGPAKKPAKKKTPARQPASTVKKATTTKKKAAVTKQQAPASAGRKTATKKQAAAGKTARKRGRTGAG
jgi:hypothetical protein